MAADSQRPRILSHHPAGTTWRVRRGRDALSHSHAVLFRFRGIRGGRVRALDREGAET